MNWVMILGLALLALSMALLAFTLEEQLPSQPQPAFGPLDRERALSRSRNRF